MRVSHIFLMNPLSDTYFISISQCVAYLVILTRSFTEQKFLILMTFNLPFFLLLWIILLMWSTDFYQTLHPKAISPMLSSKVLQVYILYLTYDLSWAYFCNFEFWDAFFFFFLLPQFNEEMVLPRVNCFVPLSSINWLYFHVVFSGFSILSCWSVSILSPWQHHSLDYCT